jgi:hypothetical protein
MIHLIIPILEELNKKIEPILCVLKILLIIFIQFKNLISNIKKN